MGGGQQLKANTAKIRWRLVLVVLLVLRSHHDRPSMVGQWASMGETVNSFLWYLFSILVSPSMIFLFVGQNMAADGIFHPVGQKEKWSFMGSILGCI